MNLPTDVFLMICDFVGSKVHLNSYNKTLTISACRLHSEMLQRVIRRFFEIWWRKTTYSSVLSSLVGDHKTLFLHPHYCPLIVRVICHQEVENRWVDRKRIK